MKFAKHIYVLEKRHSHVHLHTPLKPHSHHHGKKEKTKKGPKKKKHDHDTPKKSPEKQKTTYVEEDGTSVTPEVKEIPDEKLETNIVDQTISVLPEIGEDEILATPPKQGWLSELTDTTPVVTSIEPPTSVVESPKETKHSRHRHKHREDSDKKDSSKSGRHHKHHHRHRHKSELQERRRPGVETIKEKVKEATPEPVADTSALDQKDVEEMQCKFFNFL